MDTPRVCLGDECPLPRDTYDRETGRLDCDLCPGEYVIPPECPECGPIQLNLCATSGPLSPAALAALDALVIAVHNRLAHQDEPP